MPKILNDMLLGDKTPLLKKGHIKGVLMPLDSSRNIGPHIKGVGETFSGLLMRTSNPSTLKFCMGLPGAICTLKSQSVGLGPAILNLLISNSPLSQQKVIFLGFGFIFFCHLL